MTEPVKQTQVEIAARVHQVISALADGVLKLAQERHGPPAIETNKKKDEKNRR